MQSALPAFVAFGFAFVVFLVSYVNRGSLFFVGLFVFALAFALLHFSYRSRASIG